MYWDDINYIKIVFINLICNDKHLMVFVILARTVNKIHVFLNRVQQTVSGNKPSQYPPDTIRWTLFRCSLRG